MWNPLATRVRELFYEQKKYLPLFLSLISSLLIEHTQHIESAFCKLIKIDFPHFLFSLLLCLSVWKLCSEDIFSSPSTASFIIIFSLCTSTYTHTQQCAIVTFFYPFRLYFILSRATMNIEPFTTVVFFTMIFPLALSHSLSKYSAAARERTTGELKCIHFHVYVWERKTFSAFFFFFFFFLPPITSFFLSTSISNIGKIWIYFSERVREKKLSIFSYHHNYA